MEFSKCFEILQNRQVSSTDTSNNPTNSSHNSSCCHGSLQDSFSQAEDSTNNSSQIRTDSEQFDERTNFELLTIFQRLQEERVMTYQQFETSFAIILEEGNLSNYSFLCGEITARFKAISSTIRTLQQTLTKRNDIPNLINEIQQIQQLESNKLLLTAAQHLDSIRIKFPDLATHISQHSSPLENNYNEQKIFECEEKIRRHLENIQEIKCELL